MVDLGLVSLISVDLMLDIHPSLGLGLKLVTCAGMGEPEAIASCFASTICRLSFNSRP